MQSQQIRQLYLDFFEKKGHQILESASLIPQNDPSLLWINAGMTPLKAYFEGSKVPPSLRMASSQRCIRTNDIENVGKTPRHQTMFEMLGNFSIGDYGKKEAIDYAFEFLTSELGLPVQRLFVTVYIDDDEAYQIWLSKGISSSHMTKTKEDNFWDIGVGPCGPCSEIFYDTAPELGEESFHPDNHKGLRYLEIWNLVFSEYRHNEDGTRTLLPRQNIDTGAGLERLCLIKQQVENNFQTDLFVPIIEQLSNMASVRYDKNAPEVVYFHAIADHIRSITFMLSDGERPSNTERGYVIRRLIRRSMRFGMKLGIEGSFLNELSGKVISQYDEINPLLQDAKVQIGILLDEEERKFTKVLETGIRKLEREIKGLKTNEMPASFIFSLYDTYGFPYELTEEICEEEGITFNKSEFQVLLEEQRKRSNQKKHLQ